MIRLLGFEGGSTSPASWGAAAIETETGVRNTVSGRTISNVEFLELGASDSVTVIEAVEVPEEARSHRAVLLRIAKAAKVPDRESVTRASFHHWDSGRDEYWLFKSASLLRRTLSRVVDQLTRRALQKDVGDNYFEVASALAPKHPEMNAIWAHQKGTTLAERMASSTVGDEGRSRFTEMLDALGGRPHVTLVYDGGTASGHRLTSHAMAEVSAALERAFGMAASRAARSHPFLKHIPRPEVEERRAASVDWTLRLADENRYAAVAKSLIWLQMRQMLTEENHGHDLRSLLAPDTDVRLERVIDGEHDIRPVAPASSQEMVWRKGMSASEVQKQQVGSAMKYLRLTKGSLQPGDYADVDGGWTNYFRQVFFAEADWERGDSKESARVLMSVRFPAYYLPNVRVELDHKDRRTSHSEPKTFLVWPAEVLAVLNEGYFVGYQAILFREDGRYFLEVRPTAT